MTGSLTDVRPGDVFLVRWYNNRMSGVIAWFMRSRWSHSGVVRYRAVTGENLTLETSDFEMTYGSLEKYVAAKAVCQLRVLRVPGAFTHTELPELQVALAAVDAAYYGRMYGYLQLLSFAVVRLARRIGIRIPNFIRQGQVCTAAPLMVLSLGAHPLFAGVDPEALDTGDLAVLLEQAGAEVIFESGGRA